MTSSDGALRVLDERFRDLVPANAELERLWTGGEWVEGPVWMPHENALIFSDIPNDRMMRWSDAEGARVFRHPADKSNGNTLDLQGRIITCEHLTNRVTRTEPDGSVTTLVERYRGCRLNSPNDVVVHSSGVIWFTDPPYGILSEREGRVRESELEGNYLFSFDPGTGLLEVAATDFERPNGLAFSPDESTLYVADSGSRRHIRSFRMTKSSAGLTGGEEFVRIDQGVPDGFRVDVGGNLWSSAADGIHVFDPEGALLGKIPVPEKVSNCEFGGPEGRDLFITASTSLYRVPLEVEGALWSRFAT